MKGGLAPGGRWEVGLIAEDCLELKSIEALRASKRCAMRGIGHLEYRAMVLVGSMRTILFRRGHDNSILAPVLYRKSLESMTQLRFGDVGSEGESGDYSKIV